MSGILRVKKNANYFTASNEPFNDPNLSWDARGVMAYLLSKPDDWEVRTEDLVSKAPGGIAKVKRILKELKDNGYIRRYRVNNDKGHLEWATDVYESKQLNPEYNEVEPMVENQPIGEPMVEKPTVGKTDGRKINRILSTKEESSTKEEISTKKRGKRRPPPPPPKPNPAYDLYKKTSGFYAITNYWREKLNETVGDNPERLAFLEKVINGWCGKGWKPGNVEGILDCFNRGEIPGQEFDKARHYEPNPTKNGQNGATRQTGQDVHGPDEPGYTQRIGAAFAAKARTDRPPP